MGKYENSVGNNEQLAVGDGGSSRSGVYLTMV